MSRKKSDDQPPSPPSTRRRIHLSIPQAVGVGILLLVPILALFGVFGESWAVARGGSGGIELEVRYPDRYRYKQLNEMEVTVRNRTARVIDTLTIRVDPRYLDRFSTVQSIPSQQGLYEVPLVAVQPGEQRRAHIEYQAERYGRHSGALIATDGGADTARVQLQTIVFP